MNKLTTDLKIARNLKIKDEKIKSVLLIQHAIITNIMKYNKEFKPKIYNDNIKKTIKYLLKQEKETINDLF